MELALSPETSRFIEEQVRAGNFPTPTALVEAALADWRESDPPLDAATTAAIREGDAQGERGEGMELHDFRRHMRKFMDRNG